MRCIGRTRLTFSEPVLQISSVSPAGSADHDGRGLRDTARNPKSDTLLGDAAEALVDCARRRLEPCDPAALRHRPAGEESIQVLDAALAMELFIERVVQLAQVDGGCFVPGEVLL